MKTKQLQNQILYFGAIGISICLLFFVVASTWIGFEVKRTCNMAKDKYSGDCVEALITTLNDESNSFRTRNDAIWALGQLGDTRALPSLQKFYTGDIPDREPLNSTISQYELKKAVNLTSGGSNITAVFWRY
jgi:hypothetical protein